MVAGDAGGRSSPPFASCSRKSATSPGVASSADSSRASRKRPYCNRSVRYASRVLRERPRSNSRYARKSSRRCSNRLSTTGFSIVATVRVSPRRGSALWLQSALQEGAQPKQPDQRLRVAAVADRAVELGERPLDDLDPLVLVRLGLLVVEVRGHEEMALLVREAG